MHFDSEHVRLPVTHINYRINGVPHSYMFVICYQPRVTTRRFQLVIKVELRKMSAVGWILRKYIFVTLQQFLIHL